MLPVQFITHYSDHISHEESAMLALKGGCKWIQLRIDNATDAEVEPIAKRLQKACREHSATFILYNRVELAKKINGEIISADSMQIYKDMDIGSAKVTRDEMQGIKHYLKDSDEILLNHAEHASNLLPWYELAEQNNLKVNYIPLDNNYSVTLDNVKQSITPKTKVISIAHITNVIGDVRPIKDIIA